MDFPGFSGKSRTSTRSEAKILGKSKTSTRSEAKFLEKISRGIYSGKFFPGRNFPEIVSPKILSGKFSGGKSMVQGQERRKKRCQGPPAGFWFPFFLYSFQHGNSFAVDMQFFSWGGESERRGV